MPTTVTPAPPPLPASTATGPPPPTPRQAAPAADRHPQRQAPAPGPTPRSRSLATPGPPAADAQDPKQLDHPPPPFCSSGIHPADDPTPKAPKHMPRGPFSAPIPRNFCTRHQPPQAHPDATSRRKKPVTTPPKSRDKSITPIQRPSQPRFCTSCVIPRHRQQSPSPPFSHPPNIALLYPRRSYPDPRYFEAR